MDRIRLAAEVSIRRGMGFAALAIGVTCLGLSFDVVLALRTAAVTLGMACAILFFKGVQARTRNFRHTEVWILLDRSISLPDAVAQKLIGQVLRETYYRYGEWTLAVAVGVWLISLIAGYLLG